MVKEPLQIQMEINILELGLTIKLMEKALVDKSTVTSMKAIGKIIKDMVKENIFGIIRTNIQVIGNKMKDKEKAFYISHNKLLSNL